MLFSTANWQPMLNGYSGFMPPSFYRNARGVEEFPLPVALDYLRAQGVNWVVIDMERLSDPRKEALKSARALHLLAEEQGFRIYRLERE